MTLTKKTKALLIWASVVPVTAVFIGWLVLDNSSPDAGYALPFLGLFALLAIGAAGLIIGLWTSTLKHTMLGILLGLPITYGTGIVIGGVIAARNEMVFNAQREDFEQLLPAMHRADREALATALTKLRNTSVPRAVCVLAESSEGPNRSLISDDPQREPYAEYPFSTDTLLVLLDAVSTLDVSTAEKEAAFYSVLRTLPFRNDLRSFSRWAELWDQAHGPVPSRFIEVTQAYDVYDPSCPWGDTETFAATIVDTWNDTGIRMWLNTNHIFAPAQHRRVLERVESPELLRELVAAGVDINAANPSAHDGGYLRNPLLATRAPRIYRLINSSDSPATVVQLVETLVELGADKTAASVTGQSICELFTETEPYLDSTSSEAKVTLADRQSAFRAIKHLLCD
jgi:hypothetical protein